jgi:hypothetical protein
MERFGRLAGEPCQHLLRLGLRLVEATKVADVGHE